MNEIKPAQVRGKYFDTYVNITAYCRRSLLKEALELCEEYNSILSRFEKDSDVSRLNNADGAPVEVSEDTADIIREAMEISILSGGAFDITVGAATRLWNFTNGENLVPDSASLEAAVACSGSARIRVDGNTVTLAPGQKIDLGGIAKGYIAGEVAAFLRDQGVKSAVLDFGGDVVTIGVKPGGKPWIVGIRKPFPETPNQLWALVASADEAIVTSGTDRRGFDRGGLWQHHILDPRTGEPVQNDLLSVTVCAQSAMRADALATAFFILGPGHGAALAEKLGVQAIFLRQDGTAVCTPQVLKRMKIVK